jgi:alpha-tubulin suppressor-like RCC1 family protein
MPAVTRALLRKSFTPCDPTPTRVAGVTGAVAIAAGEFDTCVTLSNGTAACWGFPASGDPSNPTPTVVPVPGLHGVTALAVGQFHVCAIAAGSIYCWGYDEHGELGNGTTSSGTFAPGPVK